MSETSPKRAGGPPLVPALVLECQVAASSLDGETDAALIRASRATASESVPCMSSAVVTS